MANGNSYPAVMLNPDGSVVEPGTIIQYTDADDQPAASGGSQPGVPIVRGPFNITHATASLNAGVTVYTPVVGDIVLDVVVFVTTAFNGTTPTLDFGTAVGTTSGLLAAFGSAALAPTTADNETGGTGLQGSTASGTSLAESTIANTHRPNLLVTAANPLKVWVSQDGLAGGTATGATTGDIDIYVVTVTPVALP